MRCLNFFVWEVTVSCPPSAHSDVSGLSQFTESSCASLPAAPPGAGEEKGEAHCGGRQPGAVCLPAWEGGGLSPTLFAGEEGICSLERHQVPQPTILQHCEHLGSRDTD